MAPRTRALIISNSCLILLVGLRTIIASFGSKAPAYPVLPNRNHKNGHKALTHFMPTYLHKNYMLQNNRRQNCKATVIATELVHDFSNTQPLLPALGSQHQPCGFRWNLPMQRQGFGIHRLRDPPSAFLGTSPKDGFMQFIKFYNTTNATTMIVGVISRVASNTNSQQQPMLSANICTSGTYKHYICSTNLKY